MRKVFALIAFASAAALAAPALAGVPVALRTAPTAREGVVTLSDLFDGAENAAGRAVVAHAASGTQAVLDSGEVQLAAHAAGLDWDNLTGQRRVIVSMLSGPAPERAAGVGAPRHRHAQVLVYAHNLMAGDPISANDLEWSRDALAGPDAPHDPEAVIGKVARGPLREGEPVAAHQLASAEVVRRGDMISVDFVSDGVSLSLLARGMNDAAAGEPVQAMNMSSKKIIDAVATTPGHAAVGPGADAARAAPTLQTAALR